MRKYTSKASPAVDFALDEIVFTATGGVPLLEMSELAMIGDTDAESAAGAAAIARFFRALLGEEEYERFRKHCTEHQTDPDTITSVMRDLITDKSGGFPTIGSLPSSDGGEPMKPTYRVISPSGVLTEEELTPEREAELRAAVEQAFTVSEGRIPGQ